MPIKPHRPLTNEEREYAKALISRATRDPVVLAGLAMEVTVYRTELPKIRKQRRCLPAGAQAALDALPHHHATAVEFSQN